MEKRKVNGGGAVGEELDDRAAKRRKLPIDNADLDTGETPESTTKSGLQLLEALKKTVDKSKRQIATNFLTLPNKRALPDYYKIIKMPIAFDTIESKLHRQEFPNLSSLESYFKRMILNAKEYNEKGSEIFEDAERLRKALSNYMTKHNPAYKLIAGYSTLPTPIPADLNGASDAKGEADSSAAQPSAMKKKPSRPSKLVETPARKSSATPALPDSQYASVSYQGLTFQQAQEKIVEDLIREKELPDDEFSAFEPFIDLPSRSEYRDYYKVILRPVSLRTLQKSVKGSQGKLPTVGNSEFKSWGTFTEEASLIWKNAYHYNEDGSDIFVLAKELEKSFNRLLQQAKMHVSEPAGTKIKLRMPESAPPKIMLKLSGGNKASPAPVESPVPVPVLQPSNTNGNTAPANGTRRNPFGGSHSSATPIPSLEQLERARSVSASVASPSPSSISAPVKNEDVRNSPAVSGQFNTQRGLSQAASTPGPSSMQPPSTPAAPNMYSQSGYAQSFNHHTQYHAPNPGFDSKWRQPGKDASDALIVNLSLATHPQLNLSRHFRMDVPPSATMAQHSVTINLPSSHFYLQIKPELSSSVLQRHHKLFVTKGNDRLHAMPTIPSHPIDQKRPLFETRLSPGVNRIDIELIAALPKGTKSASGQDVELERITVFANLMR